MTGMIERAKPCLAATPGVRWMLAAAAVAGTLLAGPTTANPRPAVPTAANADLAPIPGPRTCFWRRGPVGADPYVNIAYPDSNTLYWAATFSMPAGSRLSIEGEFPHARYMSLISYDEAGRPMEALADYLITPDAGATNPYLPDADRTARRRGYAIEVLPMGEGLERREGRVLAGETRNILRSPAYGPGQQTIVYRIYVPDTGRTITGGVALPQPVLTLSDGSRLTGADACRAMQTDQQPLINAAALSIPVAQYRELTSLPGRPDTWPAQPDPVWHVQLDRASLIGIYTGEISPNARRSEGGFYPNPDNNYIRTIVNTRHGPVIVMRGRAPVTPATSHGEARMGTGQLRYWSICSNQSFANTRVTGCLFDEQVPVDAQGNFTIIISKAKDRPRNARPECGLAWLPIADDGDGVSDPDVAIIQIRHMLSAPDFAESIQRVESDDDIRGGMGAYFPTSRYTMPNVVESLFLCPLTQ